MSHIIRNPVPLGSILLMISSACGDAGDGRDSQTGAGGLVSASSPSGGGEDGVTGETGATGETGVTAGPLTSGDISTAAPGDTSAADGDGDDPKFDVGDAPDAAGEATGSIDCGADPDNPGCVCSIPDHVPCDNGTQDPFRAMGLNCPGELQVMTAKDGASEAFGVRSSFGQTAVFDAREGSQYAVIGSGRVAELNLPTPPGDSDEGPTHCNDALNGILVPVALPAPLKVHAVGGDCTTDPGLIGTGDCSNTIEGQFNQGGNAFDYAELRFVLEVPPDVTSFSYDFAFFSVEYPWYYGSPFNDMYVGWLDSEKWTGNISFDAQGNPISLNAGFLEFKDDGGGDPVFDGTCMRQHGGTNWLQTTAAVTPGETITVVFAIFDLGDDKLDSYAFLDNFQWGCEPTGKPQTTPPS
jgi:hypothetical protein